jgi:predicted nucleotidyltransferase
MPTLRYPGRPRCVGRRQDPSVLDQETEAGRVPRSKDTAYMCCNVWMERTEAIARPRDHEIELKRLGVQHLCLFGSTARGNAHEDSDVDLFFDYEKGKFDLFEQMDVKDAAARILGRKTDIMTRDSIHRVLRERIEAIAVPVF